METPKREFLDTLAELRANTCDRLPTPQLAVMARLTARLRRSGILQRCLQRGETAPDFTFIDADNNPGSLYALLATGPVVINFFRGDWCPYCRAEIEAYEAIRPELENSGCQYLAITPQLPAESSPDAPSDLPQMIYDKAGQIAHQFDLVYALEDEEIAVFNEWGVRQVSESGVWELPLPATYVIAQDRTVAYQFVDVDFRARCCPADLLHEIELLQR